MFRIEDYMEKQKEEIENIQGSIYCALAKKLFSETSYQKTELSVIKRRFTEKVSCMVNGIDTKSFVPPPPIEQPSRVNFILLDYMDKMLESMPETKEEIRKIVKERYHNLLKSLEFPLFESDAIISKEQLLTEYIPLRIACVFCYTFTYENYDKEAFDYISDYVEKEYQKIKQDSGNFETYSEMIAFLSNHCIEKDIFVVCKKASVQMKVDKERMKVDFQYITILVFNSMYEASKNDYDDIVLPPYSEESFEQETRALLPEGFFLENGKSIRPNTFCKKLKESDSAYVENEIRKAQYITFSKLSEELEQLLNSDTEDEYVVKETILNRISILMELYYPPLLQ